MLSLTSWYAINTCLQNSHPPMQPISYLQTIFEKVELWVGFFCWDPCAPGGCAWGPRLGLEHGGVALGGCAWRLRQGFAPGPCAWGLRLGLAPGSCTSWVMGGANLHQSWCPSNNQDCLSEQLLVCLVSRIKIMRCSENKFCLLLGL